MQCFFRIIMMTMVFGGYFQLCIEEAAAGGVIPKVEIISAFQTEGQIVGKAAYVGNIIGGAGGLVVVGIPLGIVISTVRVFSGHERADFFVGPLFGMWIGQVTGQCLIAEPVYVLKKVFYDAPKALFSIRISDKNPEIFHPEGNEHK